MKAVEYTQYGSPDMLHLTEVAKPTPKDDEVLVKVHASSINAADWLLLKGESMLVRLMAGGLQKPKNTIPGADIAGRVEAVGKAVTQFKPGDEVYGDISSHGRGGFAEYCAVPESILALKPTNLSFEQAAAVPLAGVTALQGVRDKGKVQAGQKVLINGASGGVGLFAVQIAKAFGAEVTAVCSTKNLDRVRSAGADHVIDYTKEDFARNGQHYDVIIAANGDRSLSEYKRALTPTGIYVVTGGSMKQIFQGMLLGSLMTLGGGQKMGNLAAKPSQADLIFITGLIEAGKIIPVIDRCYPLTDIVEAFRYFGDVHAKGKVVISMISNGATS